MMKLIAPALFAIALAPASASEGYELRLVEKDGQRTIAVSGGENKVAVARGGDELDVLDTTAAKTAWAQIGATLDADKDELDWKEGDTLTIRKSKPEGDAEDGKEKRIEKRVIVRKGENGESEIEIDGDHEHVVVEELEDGDLAFLDTGAPSEKRRVIRIEKKSEADGKKEKRRLIRVIGATADSARRFIDDARGLSASERATMKASAGL
jgi:hypothetical protein